MLHSSKKLLKRLSSIVSNDQDTIWINYKNQTFEKVVEIGEPKIIAKFPSKEPSISGLLENLRDEGYILLNPITNHCSLTYKALYIRQIQRQERIHYIAKSIIVPIILSLVTTLITNLALPWLSELLSGYLKSLV